VVCGLGFMMVGMVDDRSLRLRRPAPPAPKPNFFQNEWDAFKGRLPVYGNVGKAALGTVLGALDVPVQAIGGSARDAAAGSTLGGQTPGSRALQNYGQQVGGLWSDVLKPGAGQTEMFLPRQYDAAGEAAIDRFGLEGAGAGVVRGGATALDLLTGLAAGGLGSGVRAGGQAAAAAIPRIKPAFQAPEVRQAALMRAIMQDPDTYAVTTRSTNSLEDILNTGRFQSSRQTGQTGSGMFDNVSAYNPLRQKAETAVWGPEIDNVQYGQLVNNVLNSQPRPFPIGESGRKALQEYLSTARSLDPKQSLSYGVGRGANNRPDPVQYVWSPDALKRAQLYYDDSMFSQATTAQKLTKSFDEFLSSFADKGQGANWVTKKDLTKQIKDTNKKYGLDIDLPAKDWYSNRTPGGYIETQIPNLTLDDIVRIDAIPGLRNSSKAIEQALEASGRNIPTGIANVLDDSFYKMPAFANKKIRANLESLLKRLQDTFNPRKRNSGGQTLDPFDEL